MKWLDELEPSVNHAAMSGKVLAAKKKEFGLGKVKTKDQLDWIVRKARRFG